MPKTIDPPELVRTHSHYVTLSPISQFKEEVYLTYYAPWRGRASTVVMCADRYAHSSGISDWRVVVTEAREGCPAEYGDPDLSGLARQRLREILEPDVRDWLSSQFYLRSERRAYISAIKRNVYEARPWEDATRTMRALICQHSAKIGPAATTHLTSIANAYDHFTDLYNQEVPE